MAVAGVSAKFHMMTGLTTHLLVRQRDRCFIGFTFFPDTKYSAVSSSFYSTHISASAVRAFRSSQHVSSNGI